MSPAKLPVEVEEMYGGGCMMALMCRLFRMMPASMRKNAVSKDNAPNPAKLRRDLHDEFGETPYKTEEVVPGKVWWVTYTYQDDTLTDPKAREEAKKWGIDPTTEQYKQAVLAGAESHGQKYTDTCKADLERISDWYKKTEYSQEELRKTFTEELHMGVVRLAGGSLLLYSPVLIREEHGFKAWLDGLGRVDWVVVGSSFHTNYLTSVLKLYPEAKIAGTPASQDKLKVAKGLPKGKEKYDYNVQEADQTAALNTALEKEGVTLFYVAGDVGCNSVNIIAHNVLFSADLVYGAHDGDGAFGMTGEQLLEGGIEMTNIRLFRFLLMSKPHSPNGALAQYRFHMMDGASLGAMSYDLPASDGSSCSLMADSLRYLLRMEFSSVVDTHAGAMTRDNFRKDVDTNWSWLDGGSLL